MQIAAQLCRIATAAINKSSSLQPYLRPESTAAIIENSGLRPYLRPKSTAAIIEISSLQPYICPETTAAIIKISGLQPYICPETTAAIIKIAVCSRTFARPPRQNVHFAFLLIINKIARGTQISIYFFPEICNNSIAAPPRPPIFPKRRGNAMKAMKYLENKTYPEERALYGAGDLVLVNCAFDGAEDGESALKEARNVELRDCYMNLRYPLWHDRRVKLTGCRMTDTCRAALWYTEKVEIDGCDLGGVKALRECGDVHIVNTKVLSPEFGWRSRNIRIEDSSIEGEYPFLMARGLTLSNVKLKGKYSFQYTRNVAVSDSYFDTKDAFWHAKNVVIRDTVIKGEYFAWYSDNLTLERCRISGTQPFCCCTNLKLIDCELEDADLAFEYSDVDATVNSSIISVKNPRSGRIVADHIDELILTEDSVYPCECEVIDRRSARRL